MNESRQERMNSPRGIVYPQLVLAIAVGVALGGWIGCEQPNWEDPAYIKSQLEEGNRLKAFDELIKLPDDKKKELIPTLIKLYNDDKDKDRAYQQLAVLRDKQAKEVYVDALKNSNRTQDKSAAAIALGAIQARDHIPDMVQIFKTVPNEDLRRAVLESFKDMPDPAQIPLLLEILNTYDPDRESIAFHAFSCEILAEIGQATSAVVDAVVYGMFLDNAKGQNVYRECASAVFSTGAAATPKILEVLAGKNEKIATRFAKYPSYVEGASEIKAADVLGLHHDVAAVEPLKALLAVKREPPATYRNDKLLAWGANRIQFFVYSVSALGDVQAPGLVELMTPFVFPDDKKAFDPVAEPYKIMIDYDKRAKHDLALGAIEAINRSGDRAGLKVLGDAIVKGEIKELAGYSEAAVHQTRWEAAQNYARLSTAAELDAWDAILAKEARKEVKEQLTKYRPMLEVARECKAQAACYKRHLLGKDAIKAEKAAWELGRLAKGGAAEEALFEGLKTENVTLRRVIIISLFRVGTKAGLTKLEAQLASESERRTPEFKDVRFKMNALKYYLKTRG